MSVHSQSSSIKRFSALGLNFLLISALTNHKWFLLGLLHQLVSQMWLQQPQVQNYMQQREKLRGTVVRSPKAHISPREAGLECQGPVSDRTGDRYHRLQNTHHRRGFVLLSLAFVAALNTFLCEDFLDSQ